MLVGNVFLFVECNIISGRHFGPDIFSAVSLATTVSPLAVCTSINVYTTVGFVVISMGKSKCLPKVIELGDQFLLFFTTDYPLYGNIDWSGNGYGL